MALTVVHLLEGGTPAWKDTHVELELDFSEVITTPYLRLFLGSLKTTSIVIFFWSPVEQTNVGSALNLEYLLQYGLSASSGPSSLSWSTLRAKTSCDIFEVLS